MTTLRTAAVGFVTLVVFLGIDSIWLSTMSTRFYRKHLGGLMAEQPNLPVAAAFYVLYIVGLIVLVVLPAAEKQSLMSAILGGALLGAVAYGTYDFTNLATLRDWSPLVTAVDVVWGTLLTSAASTAGYFAARWLL